MDKPMSSHDKMQNIQMQVHVSKHKVFGLYLLQTYKS